MCAQPVRWTYALLGVALLCLALSYNVRGDTTVNHNNYNTESNVAVPTLAELNADFAQETARTESSSQRERTWLHAAYDTIRNDSTQSSRWSKQQTSMTKTAMSRADPSGLAQTRTRQASDTLLWPEMRENAGPANTILGPSACAHGRCPQAAMVWASGSFTFPQLLTPSRLRKSAHLTLKLSLCCCYLFDNDMLHSAARFDHFVAVLLQTSPFHVLTLAERRELFDRTRALLIHTRQGRCYDASGEVKECSDALLSVSSKEDKDACNQDGDDYLDVDADGRSRLRDGDGDVLVLVTGALSEAAVRRVFAASSLTAQNRASDKYSNDSNSDCVHDTQCTDDDVQKECGGRHSGNNSGDADDSNVDLVSSEPNTCRGAWALPTSSSPAATATISRLGADVQLRITNDVLKCKCPHTLLVHPTLRFQLDELPHDVRIVGGGAHCTWKPIDGKHVDVEGGLPAPQILRVKAPQFDTALLGGDEDGVWYAASFAITPPLLLPATEVIWTIQARNSSGRWRTVLHHRRLLPVNMDAETGAVRRSDAASPYVYVLPHIEYAVQVQLILDHEDPNTGTSSQGEQVSHTRHRETHETVHTRAGKHVGELASVRRVAQTRFTLRTPFPVSSLAHTRAPEVHFGVTRTMRVSEQTEAQIRAALSARRRRWGNALRHLRAAEAEARATAGATNDRVHVTQDIMTSSEDSSYAYENMCDDTNDSCKGTDSSTNRRANRHHRTVHVCAEDGYRGYWEQAASTPEDVSAGLAVVHPSHRFVVFLGSGEDGVDGAECVVAGVPVALSFGRNVLRYRVEDAAGVCPAVELEQQEVWSIQAIVAAVAVPPSSSHPHTSLAETVCEDGALNAWFGVTTQSLALLLRHLQHVVGTSMAILSDATAVHGGGEAEDARAVGCASQTLRFVCTPHASSAVFSSPANVLRLTSNASDSARCTVHPSPDAVSATTREPVAQSSSSSSSSRQEEEEGGSLDTRYCVARVQLPPERTAYDLRWVLTLSVSPDLAQRLRSRRRERGHDAAYAWVNPTASAVTLTSFPRVLVRHGSPWRVGGPLSARLPMALEWWTVAPPHVRRSRRDAMRARAHAYPREENRTRDGADVGTHADLENIDPMKREDGAIDTYTWTEDHTMANDRYANEEDGSIDTNDGPREKDEWNTTDHWGSRDGDYTRHDRRTNHSVEKTLMHRRGADEDRGDVCETTGRGYWSVQPPLRMAGQEGVGRWSNAVTLDTRAVPNVAQTLPPHTLQYVLPDCPAVYAIRPASDGAPMGGRARWSPAAVGNGSSSRDVATGGDDNDNDNDNDGGALPYLARCPDRRVSVEVRVEATPAPAPHPARESRYTEASCLTLHAPRRRRKDERVEWRVGPDSARPRTAGPCARVVRLVDSAGSRDGVRVCHITPHVRCPVMWRAMNAVGVVNKTFLLHRCQPPPALWLVGVRQSGGAAGRTFGDDEYDTQEKAKTGCNKEEEKEEEAHGLPMEESNTNEFIIEDDSSECNSTKDALGHPGDGTSCTNSPDETSQLPHTSDGSVGPPEEEEEEEGLSVVPVAGYRVPMRVLLNYTHDDVAGAVQVELRLRRGATRHQCPAAQEDGDVASAARHRVAHSVWPPVSIPHWRRGEEDGSTPLWRRRRRDPTSDCHDTTLEARFGLRTLAPAAQAGESVAHAAVKAPSGEPSVDRSECAGSTQCAEWTPSASSSAAAAAGTTAQVELYGLGSAAVYELDYRVRPAAPHPAATTPSWADAFAQRGLCRHRRGRVALVALNPRGLLPRRVEFCADHTHIVRPPEWHTRLGYAMDWRCAEEEDGGVRVERVGAMHTVLHHSGGAAVRTRCAVTVRNARTATAQTESVSVRRVFPAPRCGRWRLWGPQVLPHVGTRAEACGSDAAGRALGQDEDEEDAPFPPLRVPPNTDRPGTRANPSSWDRWEEQEKDRHVVHSTKCDSCLGNDTSSSDSSSYPPPPPPRTHRGDSVAPLEGAKEDDAAAGGAGGRCDETHTAPLRHVVGRRVVLEWNEDGLCASSSSSSSSLSDDDDEDDDEANSVREGDAAGQWRVVSVVPWHHRAPHDDTYAMRRDVVFTPVEESAGGFVGRGASDTDSRPPHASAARARYGRHDPGDETGEEVAGRGGNDTESAATATATATTAHHHCPTSSGNSIRVADDSIADGRHDVTSTSGEEDGAVYSTARAPSAATAHRLVPSGRWLWRTWVANLTRPGLYTIALDTVDPLHPRLCPGRTHTLTLDVVHATAITTTLVVCGGDATIRAEPLGRVLSSHFVAMWEVYSHTASSSSSSSSIEPDATAPTGAGRQSRRRPEQSAAMRAIRFANARHAVTTVSNLPFGIVTLRWAIYRVHRPRDAHTNDSEDVYGSHRSLVDYDTVRLLVMTENMPTEQVTTAAASVTLRTTGSTQNWRVVRPGRALASGGGGGAVRDGGGTDTGAAAAAPSPRLRLIADSHTRQSPATGRMDAGITRTDDALHRLYTNVTRAGQTSRAEEQEEEEEKQQQQQQQQQVMRGASNGTVLDASAWLRGPGLLRVSDLPIGRVELRYDLVTSSRVFGAMRQEAECVPQHRTLTVQRIPAFVVAHTTLDHECDAYRGSAEMTLCLSSTAPSTAYGLSSDNNNNYYYYNSDTSGDEEAVVGDGQTPLGLIALDELEQTIKTGAAAACANRTLLPWWVWPSTKWMNLRHVSHMPVATTDATKHKATNHTDSDRGADGTVSEDAGRRCVQFGVVAGRYLSPDEAAAPLFRLRPAANDSTEPADGLAAPSFITGRIIRTDGKAGDGDASADTLQAAMRRNALVAEEATAPYLPIMVTQFEPSGHHTPRSNMHSVDGQGRMRGMRALRGAHAVPDTATDEEQLSRSDEEGEVVVSLQLQLGSGAEDGSACAEDETAGGARGGCRTEERAVRARRDGGLRDGGGECDHAKRARSGWRGAGFGMHASKAESAPMGHTHASNTTTLLHKCLAGVVTGADVLSHWRLITPPSSHGFRSNGSAMETRRNKSLHAWQEYVNAVRDHPIHCEVFLPRHGARSNVAQSKTAFAPQDSASWISLTEAAEQLRRRTRNVTRDGIDITGLGNDLQKALQRRRLTRSQLVALGQVRNGSADVSETNGTEETEHVGSQDDMLLRQQQRQQQQQRHVLRAYRALAHDNTRRGEADASDFPEEVALLRFRLPRYAHWAIPEDLSLRAVLHKSVVCGTSLHGGDSAHAGSSRYDEVTFGRVLVRDVAPRLRVTPLLMKQCEIESRVPALRVYVQGGRVAAPAAETSASTDTNAFRVTLDEVFMDTPPSAREYDDGNSYNTRLGGSPFATYATSNANRTPSESAYRSDGDNGDEENSLVGLKPCLARMQLSALTQRVPSSPKQLVIHLGSCPALQMIAPAEYGTGRNSAHALRRLRTPRWLRVTVHDMLQPDSFTGATAPIAAHDIPNRFADATAAASLGGRAGKTVPHDSKETSGMGDERVHYRGHDVWFDVEVRPTLARLHLRRVHSRELAQTDRERNGSSHNSSTHIGKLHCNIDEHDTIAAAAAATTRNNDSHNDSSSPGVDDSGGRSAETSLGRAADPFSQAHDILSRDDRATPLLCESDLRQRGFELGVELIGDDWVDEVGRGNLAHTNFEDRSAADIALVNSFSAVTSGPQNVRMVGSRTRNDARRSRFVDLIAAASSASVQRYNDSFVVLHFPPPPPPPQSQHRNVAPREYSRTHDADRGQRRRLLSQLYHDGEPDGFGSKGDIEEILFSVPGLATRCRGCLLADTTFLVAGDWAVRWQVTRIAAAAAAVTRREVSHRRVMKSAMHQKQKSAFSHAVVVPWYRVDVMPESWAFSWLCPRAAHAALSTIAARSRVAVLQMALVVHKEEDEDEDNKKELATDSSSEDHTDGIIVVETEPMPVTAMLRQWKGHTGHEMAPLRVSNGSLAAAYVAVQAGVRVRAARHQPHGHPKRSWVHKLASLLHLKQSKSRHANTILGTPSHGANRNGERDLAWRHTRLPTGELLVNASLWLRLCVPSHHTDNTSSSSSRPFVCTVVSESEAQLQLTAPVQELPRPSSHRLKRRSWRRWFGSKTRKASSTTAATAVAVSNSSMPAARLRRVDAVLSQSLLQKAYISADSAPAHERTTPTSAKQASKDGWVLLHHLLLVAGVFDVLWCWQQRSSGMGQAGRGGSNRVRDAVWTMYNDDRYRVQRCSSNNSNGYDSDDALPNGSVGTVTRAAAGAIMLAWLTFTWRHMPWLWLLTWLTLWMAFMYRTGRTRSGLYFALSVVCWRLLW